MTPETAPLQGREFGYAIRSHLMRPGFDGPEADDIRRTIIEKTGVLLIEWAAMHVNVLAVKPEFDILKDKDDSAGARLLTRNDLSAKLRLKCEAPFGIQLQDKGVLTPVESRFLDENFFTGWWNCGFRIKGSRVEALSLVVDLEARQLVERASDLHCEEDHCYIKIVTCAFAELSKILPRGGAALVSLNDAFALI